MSNSIPESWPPRTSVVETLQENLVMVTVIYSTRTSDLSKSRNFDNLREAQRWSKKSRNWKYGVMQFYDGERLLGILNSDGEYSPRATPLNGSGFRPLIREK